MASLDHALQRGRAIVGEPRNARRVVIGLWLVWAVLVWHVIFDHAIVVAGRGYIVAAGIAAKGSGAYARMDDWMQPAKTEGALMATAAAALIVAVGTLGAFQATRRKS